MMEGEPTCKICDTEIRGVASALADKIRIQNDELEKCSNGMKLKTDKC